MTLSAIINAFISEFTIFGVISLFAPTSSAMKRYLLMAVRFTKCF